MRNQLLDNVSNDVIFKICSLLDFKEKCVKRGVLSKAKKPKFSWFQLGEQWRCLSLKLVSVRIVLF